MVRVLRYLGAVTVALNQLASAATGGDPQMSMSARAAFSREAGSKLGTFWCATLDLMDHHHPDKQGRYRNGADHCEIAIVDYRIRKENHK